MNPMSFIWRSQSFATLLYLLKAVVRLLNSVNKSDKWQRLIYFSAFKHDESVGKITAFVSRTVRRPNNLTADHTFEVLSIEHSPPSSRVFVSLKHSKCLTERKNQHFSVKIYILLLFPTAKEW